jgi:glycosyltransferase involved in cell wall biosynthesis
MAKLTAVIPCGNERDTIRGCVESVRWADEIFVVESFSTDGTIDIVKDLGVRYVRHEYVNSAAQKNWAIPQCSHEWVLIVDSDERVTPELAAEARAIVNADGPCNGYYIRRENYFLGGRVRYSGWQSDKVLRLFRRDKGRYQPRHVHADILLDGEPGMCKHVLTHHTCRNLADYMKKLVRYAEWGAMNQRDKGKKPGRLRLVTVPTFRFLRSYVLKAGFLDGWRGLVIAGALAAEGFMREAFLWQLRNAEAQAAASGDARAPK